MRHSLDVPETTGRNAARLGELGPLLSELVVPEAVRPAEVVSRLRSECPHQWADAAEVLASAFSFRRALPFLPEGVTLLIGPDQHSCHEPQCSRTHY
jgi:hypothetical protein